MKHLKTNALAVSVLAMAASLVQSCSFPTGQHHPGDSHTIILNDYEAARANAIAEGRLLLVNSTGHNAANARFMEVKTFQDPQVAEALSRFVEARLYSDDPDPITRKANQLVLDKVVHERAVPVYVALHPQSGKELGRCSGASLVPSEFAEFLSDAVTGAQ